MTMTQQLVVDDRAPAEASGAVPVAEVRIFPLLWGVLEGSPLSAPRVPPWT
jgi:hypothetical protein